MRYRKVCCTGIWVVRLPGHLCRVCFSARLLGFTYYKKKSSIDHEVIENLNLPFAAVLMPPCYQVFCEAFLGR